MRNLDQTEEIKQCITEIFIEYGILYQYTAIVEFQMYPARVFCKANADDLASIVAEQKVEGFLINIPSNFPKLMIFHKLTSKLYADLF